MKQKVEIQMCIKDNNSRTKAMKIAVSVPGVESATLKGPEKNKIEVTGDGIDAVLLTTQLRKKVGFAELISVTPVQGGGGSGGGVAKTLATPAPPCNPYYCYAGAPQYSVYEIRQPCQDPCSIM